MIRTTSSMENARGGLRCSSSVPSSAPPAIDFGRRAFGGACPTGCTFDAAPAGGSSPEREESSPREGSGAGRVTTPRLDRITQPDECNEDQIPLDFVDVFHRPSTFI